MGLRTCLSFTGVVVTSLALTLRHSDCPMALDNKQAALRIPPKTAKF